MLDTVTLMREINPDYKFLPEVFWSLGVYGFRGLGSRGLGFRGLGFRGLGFRGLGFS